MEIHKADIHHKRLQRKHANGVSFGYRILAKSSHYCSTTALQDGNKRKYLLKPVHVYITSELPVITGKDLLFPVILKLFLPLPSAIAAKAIFTSEMKCTVNDIRLNLMPLTKSYLGQFSTGRRLATSTSSSFGPSVPSLYLLGRVISW